MSRERVRNKDYAKADASALNWAKKENFPWPHVLPSVKNWKFPFMKYRNRYVPQYILLDKEGNKVAEGLNPSLKFIESH